MINIQHNDSMPEKRHINRLNKEFFQNVDLTTDEAGVLLWLCSWDEYLLNNIISAFKKVTRSTSS